MNEGLVLFHLTLSSLRATHFASGSDVQVAGSLTRCRAGRRVRGRRCDAASGGGTGCGAGRRGGDGIVLRRGHRGCETNRTRVMNCPYKFCFVVNRLPAFETLKLWCVRKWVIAKTTAESVVMRRCKGVLLCVCVCVCVCVVCVCVCVCVWCVCVCVCARAHVCSTCQCVCCCTRVCLCTDLTLRTRTPSCCCPCSTGRTAPSRLRSPPPSRGTGAPAL